MTELIVADTDTFGTVAVIITVTESQHRGTMHSHLSITQSFAITHNDPKARTPN